MPFGGSALPGYGTTGRIPGSGPVLGPAGPGPGVRGLGMDGPHSPERNQTTGDCRTAGSVVSTPNWQFMVHGSNSRLEQQLPGQVFYLGTWVLTT